MSRLISLDPGLNKCGLLLVDKELRIVLDGRVVAKDAVINLINFWQDKYSIELILLGNGTSSNYWKLEIEKNTSVAIELFEEKNTTLRARSRYWELWPKSFFLSLIPSGLLVPSENLDAVAALVLLEDYLKIQFKWPYKKNFKTLT